MCESMRNFVRKWKSRMNRDKECNLYQKDRHIIVILRDVIKYNPWSSGREWHPFQSSFSCSLVVFMSTKEWTRRIARKTFPGLWIDLLVSREPDGRILILFFSFKDLIFITEIDGIGNMKHDQFCFYSRNSTQVLSVSLSS